MKDNNLISLDLSKYDVRVRCVLQRLDVDTADKLLALTKNKLKGLRNCGEKTIEKIIQLQIDYGSKELRDSCKDQEQIDKAIEKGREYVNKLIAVTKAANELIKATKNSGRHHFYVSKQKFNILKSLLESFNSIE